jgi:hypothetical protein
LAHRVILRQCNISVAFGALRQSLPGRAGKLQVLIPIVALYEAFGLSGEAELIYLVGLYCLVSVTLNDFDVPVPEKEAPRLLSGGPCSAPDMKEPSYISV